MPVDAWVLNALCHGTFDVYNQVLVQVRDDDDMHTCNDGLCPIAVYDTESGALAAKASYDSVNPHFPCVITKIDLYRCDSN